MRSAISRPDRADVVELNGIRAGILVCEDAWEPEPAAGARRRGGGAAGHQCLALRSAQAGAARARGARPRVTETSIPLVFVNLIGGQDELVFDGNSFAMDARGEVTTRAPAFTKGCIPWIWLRASTVGSGRCPGPLRPGKSEEESVYGALVQGTRDYVTSIVFRASSSGSLEAWTPP